MTQAPQTLSDKQMAALLAMLVAIMPFSVDAYLPAIPAMAEVRAFVRLLDGWIDRVGKKPKAV